MKDEANALFGHLLEGLSVRTRWMVVLFLLIAIASMFVFYEHITRKIYYSNMEKQVVVLEKLNELSNDGIQKDTLLVHVYEALVTDIYEEPVGTVSDRLRSDIKAENIYKFLASASIGILGLIASLAAKKKNKSAIIGSIMLIAVFGTMGLSLPTIIHPAVNYILIPVMQLVILVFYITRLTRVKEAAMQNACRANMRTIDSQLVIFQATNKSLPKSPVEFRLGLPELQGIICPTCKISYKYVYENEKYRIECPNKKSHGYICNRKPSWTKVKSKVQGTR